MSMKWLLFPGMVVWMYTYNFHFNYECCDEETLDVGYQQVALFVDARVVMKEADLAAANEPR